MKKREHGHGDFELNLAPIIDCFTVLVTFMLASSSFLSIGFLDAGLNANAAPTEAKEPQVNLELKVLSDGFQIELSGKSQLKKKVGPAELLEQLKSLKSSYSDLTSMTLSADPEVSYEKVVATMDQVRPVFSQILLGGF